MSTVPLERVLERVQLVLWPKVTDEAPKIPRLSLECLRWVSVQFGLMAGVPSDKLVDSGGGLC